LKNLSWLLPIGARGFNHRILKKNPSVSETDLCIFEAKNREFDVSLKD